MANYEYLRPYCDTDRQREVLDAVARRPTIRAAADYLGMAERNIYEMLRRLKKRAADKGVAPEENLDHKQPEGQRVAGISTLYDADGEVTARWVKTRAEAENVRSDILEAIEAFKESVPKAVAAPGPQKPGKAELLNCHVLTDFHLGMHAWNEDAGEDWDLKIAEKMLVDWFAFAIKNAPAAHTGLLAQLGDFLHWDGIEPVTPIHRNTLDADTRFQKVVRVAIRSLRQIIHLMLKKYEHVHLVMADANHDPASSAWMREMFAAFYDEEPRISVDKNADTYYCFEHGATSLFFHHGHRKRPTNVDDVFAAKFRDVFGRTKHSYAHMGHLHHRHLLETNLMLVEQHRTMAAKDAYASKGGWMAGRDAVVITYHRDFGEVGRFSVTPEMLA